MTFDGLTADCCATQAPTAKVVKKASERNALANTVAVLFEIAVG
jgi:hypothetical protein